MNQWIKAVSPMVGVLVFAAAAYAALTTLNGEVIKYEAGKTISVKDFTGNVLALEITEDTKVEGEVRVGAQVAIEADGKKVQSVKAMASRSAPGGMSGGG